MDYFTVQAPSYTDAVSKVKEKYGEKAHILTQRKVRLQGFGGLFGKQGIEVNGYLKPETVQKKRTLPSIGDLEEEKRRFVELRGVDSGTVMTQILAEVKALKSQIAEQGAQNADAIARAEPDAVRRMEELLEANEFPPRYIRKILARIKAEFTFDELENWQEVQDRVLEWIGDDILIGRDDKKHAKPRVVVLVGPTGVGKTTTIAKLAARYGIGSGGMPKKKVRILTIDNYRIGAKQQIETFGEIMGIPVSCAETPDDLRKFITFFHDVDMIFVDTIGKSPKDYVNLGKMQGVLKECGTHAEIMLALSATTKGSDLAEIAQQFEPFNYRSIVVTKLDETNKVGSLIGMLVEKQKTVSWITTGQIVPHDIEAATVPSLLTRLEGFRVQRERIEERYSNRTE